MNLVKLKARCIKPCFFKYGSCEEKIINVHPRYKKRYDLLKDKDGFFLCHRGRLLTIYDKICEECGCDLEFDKEKSSADVAVYQCKECNKKIEMEVL